jgi:hypothetical protein
MNCNHIMHVMDKSESEVYTILITTINPAVSIISQAKWYKRLYEWNRSVQKKTGISIRSPGIDALRSCLTRLLVLHDGAGEGAVRFGQVIGGLLGSGAAVSRC